MDWIKAHRMEGGLFTAGLAFVLAGLALVAQPGHGLWGNVGWALTISGVLLLIAALLLWEPVAQKIRRPGPSFCLTTGTGNEYQFMTSMPKEMTEQFADLARGSVPPFRPIRGWSTRLRLKETANVPAKNLSVQIKAAYPAPEEGEIDFPAPLSFWEAQAKSRDFGPEDRDYVQLLEVIESEDGRLWLMPPFLAFHNSVALDIEVLIDGKSHAVQRFSVSGHPIKMSDGQLYVENHLPEVTEIPMSGEGEA